ncbi:MAG: hypothetical protein J0H50_11705 [Xanthomonadales bacterium]|nr:hypothetical protein [Xanthomonadales bacterium]
MNGSRNLTLLDVRDWHRFSAEAAALDGNTTWANTHNELADVIDANIAKPEPNKQGDGSLSSRLRPNVECAPWVIEAVRKLEAERVSVPEGWKLVPIEPTDAMVKEGARRRQNSAAESVREGYRAMLAAAPSQPAIHSIAGLPSLSAGGE